MDNLEATANQAQSCQYCDSLTDILRVLILLSLNCKFYSSFFLLALPPIVCVDLIIIREHVGRLCKNYKTKERDAFLDTRIPIDTKTRCKFS